MELGELAARFVVGGLLGYAIEKKTNPELKGSLPGVPFRPIYGVGAALSQDNLSANMLVSMCAEELGNEHNLWRYDIENPCAIDKNVRVDYSLAFGMAMTAFSKLWKKCL